MANEDERSLQKRPELLPEKLMEGGVIVGVEPSVKGSLVGMSGLALERITRERLGTTFQLPERPVYLLDPDSRRMIMQSYRERRTPSGQLIEHKSGLFAEIVEVDEQGKPHFRLTTSEVILPNESYQVAHIAPNKNGLPPSYIEVTEEEQDEKGEKKKKFVPWNIYLGQLQFWMNEATIKDGESIQDFISRFTKARDEGEYKATEKIEESFPQGEQGFHKKIVPANMIITNQGEDGYLFRASLAAGLYPFIVSPERVLVRYMELLSEKLPAGFRPANINWHLPSSLKGHFPAVVTLDEESADPNIVIPGGWRMSAINDTFSNIQKSQPIFSLVSVITEPSETKEEFKRKYPKLTVEPTKLEHGFYHCPPSETDYQQLLQKLKADLVLTIFLRGGAPIVK